jgi:hypothetical protein
MRLPAYSTVAAAAIGLMLTYALPAAATQYTVTMRGFINGSPGTTFGMSFHLDDSAPDEDPDPTVGIYHAISDLHGSVKNGPSFSSNPGNQEFLVQNNFLGVQDYISLEDFDVTGSDFGGKTLTEVGFGFCCDLSIVNSDAIPDFSTLLNTGAQHNFLLLYGSLASPTSLPGTITSIFVSTSGGPPPVAGTPTPGALPLFVSALAGFGFIGWRRGSRAVR